jgi:hypothetical protein
MRSVQEPPSYFRCSVVVLAASLPHAKVGRSIRSFDVIDEVLHKSHFVHRVDDLQSGRDHLHQHEQIQTDHVDLQVTIITLVVQRKSSVQVELGVQRMLRALIRFERFHFVRGLSHPRKQNASPASFVIITVNIITVNIATLPTHMHLTAL